MDKQVWLKSSFSFLNEMIGSSHKVIRVWNIEWLPMPIMLSLLMEHYAITLHSIWQLECILRCRKNNIGCSIIELPKHTVIHDDRWLNRSLSQIEIWNEWAKQTKHLNVILQDFFHLSIVCHSRTILLIVFCNEFGIVRRIVWRINEYDITCNLMSTHEVCSYMSSIVHNHRAHRIIVLYP